MANNVQLLFLTMSDQPKLVTIRILVQPASVNMTMGPVKPILVGTLY